MYEFSSSMIDTFAACPMRGHYAYLDGGNGIRPDRKPRELVFGSIWHAGMEAYYGGGDPYLAMSREAQKQIDSMDQVWEEDRENMSGLLKLAEGMMHNYRAWDAGQPQLGAVIAVEKEFRARIYKPGGRRAVAAFRGKPDLAVEDGDGFLILWDHKSVSSFDADFEAMNHLNRQFRRYAWAWQQETGRRVAGFGVNAARKKVPAVPQKLVKGGLSKDKRIDTTREIYLGTIKACDLDPADYVEILEILPDLNAFFRRDLIYFSQDEIAGAGEELYWIYRRMTSKIPPLKMPTPLCTKFWPCAYRPICVEDSPEARMMYRPKERRLEELS